MIFSSPKASLTALRAYPGPFTHLPVEAVSESAGISQ